MNSLTLIFILNLCGIALGHLLVQTLQGTVQGYHKHSYNGRVFTSFEGIPYAQPPTGNLRFKEPKPGRNWNGILHANKSKKICPQLNDELKFIGNEDCLYLNIYIPKENVNENDNLDVVLHFHGGSLMIGSTYENSLPDYLMDKNLIMVALNYRLGAAGFMSTGNRAVSGNNGFKDQVLGMKWIKNNIKKFGGSPNSVTITGFSSGGSSVHFHYISPLSKGLFQRGLSTSYTALGSASLTLNPLEKAKKLAEMVNCPERDLAKMVSCLRRKPIEELVEANIWFRPVVEKDINDPFLPDFPYRLIMDEKIYNVPWVTTNTVNESLFSLDSLYKNRSEIFGICSNLTEWGRTWLDLEDYLNENQLENAVGKLSEHYLENCKLNVENGLEKINKMMTHRHFLTHSDLSLRTHSKASKSPVYYYLFEYIPGARLEFGGPPAASHGIDSRLMFKYRTNPEKLGKRDEKMMSLLVDFIEKYARTGIPKIGDVEWKPIDPSKNTLNTLLIKSPEDIKMVKFDELVPRKLWNSLPIKENKNLVN